MTSVKRDYPARVDVTFQDKEGRVVLDRIRTVDKSRLVRRMGHLPEDQARKIADTLILTACFWWRGNRSGTIEATTRQRASGPGTAAIRPVRRPRSGAGMDR